MPSPAEPSPAEPSPGATAGPCPAPVPGVSELRFDRVELVVGGGPRSVPAEMVARFDQRGMELAAVDHPWLPLVPWSEVSTVTVGAEQPGPSGGIVVPVEVVSGGRTLRLLVGSARPLVAIAALEAWLAAWSASAPRPAPGASTEPATPAMAPVPATPSIGHPPIAPPPPDAGRYAHRHRRPRPRRRWATLVAGLVLLCSGIGLAAALAVEGHVPASAARVVPERSADQRLAERAVLTRSDLPPGWTTESPGDPAASSPQWQHDEAGITQSFASCAGVSVPQATVMLGGQGPDQTAQASSPLFEAPSSPAAPGVSVGLETAAATVRSHRDEQSDFSLYADPDYPQCAAAAIASQLQLGANQASGTHDLPGPATATVERIAAPAGEQLDDLIVSFDVTDRTGQGGTGPVPTEVEVVSLGSARVEAELEAFAIGGRIPSTPLARSLAILEHRVATAGRA